MQGSRSIFTSQGSVVRVPDPSHGGPAAGGGGGASEPIAMCPWRDPNKTLTQVGTERDRGKEREVRGGRRNLWEGIRHMSLKGRQFLLGIPGELFRFEHLPFL